MSSPERAPSPKQLVILSGKGGTGKTSLVASLAALAPSKVLADCDVDASDLHLLLDPSPRLMETFRAGKEALIAPDRCCRCGLCAEYCRFDAIRTAASNGGKPAYSVDPIACEGCGLCSIVCTSKAITMLEAERGRWFVSDTRHGPLVHAQLNIGGENSGKLVTVVRNQAMALAQETGAALVIVDGPPGIGCPVIASVTGADLVLAITEPTVSGLHDLERLARLVKGFDLPIVVCINKVDLNLDMASGIRDLCAAHEVEVVGELAYDTAVVHAQVQGRSIVETGDGPVADQIRAIWSILENKLIKMED
jgi:MinD superfamily P-loop ATPase